ncbi:MAG: HAMP domain-containing histidine kinase [Lachnospiraceae bacterium]|nr:HAMP domain-containing histidine kinase [Lachnospiraceae bacterium]
MEGLLVAVIGILLAVIIVLWIKIYLLQKGAQEICDAFVERLATDTNTLIDISTRDKYMLKLADVINEQLRLLRKQRHKYLNGDRELKEAVTNISHDLRTPLTAICGYMDLLESEEKSETVTRYLSLISNRTEALKQLTEELFRYSVILSTQEEMDMEMVHVNGVLEESIASFYGVLKGRGITPVIRLTEKRIERQLNKEALSRVFSNILNNALKYSDGDLEIILQADGTVIFSNSARNLNEVQVGKLFDRFFTVEAARNSNGLGLSIAKTLVEHMGGRVTAQLLEQRLSIMIEFIEVN